MKSHQKYVEQLLFSSYLYHHHNDENVTESLHQYEIGMFVSISHNYSSNKIDTC